MGRYSSSQDSNYYSWQKAKQHKFIQFFHFFHNIFSYFPLCQQNQAQMENHWLNICLIFGLLVNIPIGNHNDWATRNLKLSYCVSSEKRREKRNAPKTSYSNIYSSRFYSKTFQMNRVSTLSNYSSICISSLFSVKVFSFSSPSATFV